MIHLLALFFSLIVEGMTPIAYNFPTYKSGTVWHYATNLTNGSASSWIVIPPTIKEVTCYLIMLSNTNHGRVVTTYVKLSELTNEDVGVPWVSNGVSTTTVLTYGSPLTAVRAERTSNSFRFYVIAR